MLGDVEVTARALLAAAARRRRMRWTSGRTSPTAGQIWRAEKARRVADDRGRGIGSASVFDALTRLAPADAVIAVDVGNHAYSFGRYFECDRQTVLMSGYLGSIGFGFPAAMGAWAAAPDRRVDRRHRRRRVRPVPGRADDRREVRHADHRTCCSTTRSSARSPRNSGPPRWACGTPSLLNPDFAAYARSCGALGIRVEAAGRTRRGAGRRAGHAGPALVEVITDAEAHIAAPGPCQSLGW